MEKIIYIADLGEDIDDIIAVQYLYNKDVLDGIVLSPYQIDKEGLNRLKQLEEIGIKVYKEIPVETKNVFVGGSLTPVATYIRTNTIENLVMNGGFVGCNIVKNPLPKFKNKKTVRTFNFNCAIDSTDKVLKSNKIKNIYLIGKNVCHDNRNTVNGIWNCEKSLITKYCKKTNKLQHDMLACREGLVFLGLLDEPHWISYKEVKPFNTGLNGTFTQWGSYSSESKLTPYRKVVSAIDWL